MLARFVDKGPYVDDGRIEEVEEFRITFSSRHKYERRVYRSHKEKEGLTMLFKGAPQTLARICRRADRDGESEDAHTDSKEESSLMKCLRKIGFLRLELSQEHAQELHSRNEMGWDGVDHVATPIIEGSLPSAEYSGLAFWGPPPRASASQDVAALREMGTEICLATGDHRLTATCFADACGISKESSHENDCHYTPPYPDIKDGSVFARVHMDLYSQIVVNWRSKLLSRPGSRRSRVAVMCSGSDTRMLDAAFNADLAILTLKDDEPIPPLMRVRPACIMPGHRHTSAIADALGALGCAPVHVD